MHTMKTLMWTAVVIFLMSVAVSAQEKTEAPESKAPATYRMQYTIVELADGKRVNSRTYETMIAEPPQHQATWSKIRMGNKIPLTSEKGPTYMDTGLSIDAGLRKWGDQLYGSTRFELNSVAPEQQGSQSGAPVLRSIKLEADNALVLGQKTVIAGGDDVNTNHRFEIELVVTRIK